MKPIPFPEQTVVIAKDQPEYLPLPAHRIADDPQWRERFAVLWRGVIWQQVLTFHLPLQPQLLTVEKPEIKTPEASQ